MIRQIKQYFGTRRTWGLETGKRLKYQALELQNYWSEIMKQQIEKTRKSIEIEKNAEIEILENELINKKAEIKYLKSVDLETEKLQNELRAKIQLLDYQKKLLEEIRNQMSVRLGICESSILDSEKLLRRDV